MVGAAWDQRPIAGASYDLVSNYDLKTRFGPARAAEFQIRTDQRIKLCVVFLSRFERAALSQMGWFCNANGARPSVNGLAWMRERISLKAPLPSAVAQAFQPAAVPTGAVQRGSASDGLRAWRRIRAKTLVSCIIGR
jgi:hypothetical protein